MIDKSMVNLKEANVTIDITRNTCVNGMVVVIDITTRFIGTDMSVKLGIICLSSRE